MIGSVEQRRSGVEVKDVLDALKNPIDIEAPKHGPNGSSTKFKGEKCFVAVDPDTGVLIQTNPHSTRTGVKR